MLKLEVQVLSAMFYSVVHYELHLSTFEDFLLIIWATKRTKTSLSQGKHFKCLKTGMMKQMRTRKQNSLPCKLMAVTRKETGGRNRRTEWRDTDGTVRDLLPKCLSEKPNKPACSETMEGKYISNRRIQMFRFCDCILRNYLNFVCSLFNWVEERCLWGKSLNGQKFLVFLIWNRWTKI